MTKKSSFRTTSTSSKSPTKPSTPQIDRSKWRYLKPAPPDHRVYKKGWIGGLRIAKASTDEKSGQPKIGGSQFGNARQPRPSRQVAAKRIALFDWHGSNIAGGDWTWHLYVTLRKDHTYSVSARQRLHDSHLPFGRRSISSYFRLRTGEQVLDAVCRLFIKIDEDVDADALEAIGCTLHEVDDQLAMQYQAAHVVPPVPVGQDRAGHAGGNTLCQ